MKKTIISVMLTISLVFTLLCGIQMNARNPYTIPLAVTPPEIDGVMSEDEWKGAYHYQINNQIGYQWSSNPSQKEGCTMFDLYMMWYNDPEESGELLDVKKGGIYIAVKAQDPERGYAYPDGGAFNGADAIQFAIDPFNYQDTNPSSAYLFDLAPYTASMDPDQPFGPASNYEHWQWNGKIPAQFKMTQEATVTADGYLMEVFIPWSVMHQYEMLPDHEIGTVMGMGFVFMDFIQQSPYYYVIDFGNGMSLEEAINNPRVFNQVTLGDVAKDEPPAPTYGKGDVNKNGQIDMEECVMALQHVASLVIQEGETFEILDLNEDGKITMDEAVILLQVNAKLIPSVDDALNRQS